MDYQNALNDLLAGKISELVVEPQDFMAFQQIWTNLEARKEIVGTAQQNGKIIYRRVNK